MTGSASTGDGRYIYSFCFFLRKGKGSGEGKGPQLLRSGGWRISKKANKTNEKPILLGPLALPFRPLQDSPFPLFFLLFFLSFFLIFPSFFFPIPFFFPQILLICTARCGASKLIKPMKNQSFWYH